MKDYWNNLFKERDKVFSHEPYLEDDIKLFIGGNLLDLGAGDGRNTIFFHNRGFNVTEVDYSIEGIKKLNYIIKDLSIKTQIWDLVNGEVSEIEARFNTITLIHFFPGVEYIKKIKQLLKPGGIIYCITFINDNIDRDSSRFSIGISRGEIERVKKEYSIVKEVYREDPRGEFYTFIIE